MRRPRIWLRLPDAPPTIDGTLKAAFEAADIYYPFTDLLVADPYAAMADGVILAFYIGPSGMVGDTKTEMLAWANPEVFLQIWIGVDDKLPRRVRAVYSADPLALHHQLDLSCILLEGVSPVQYACARGHARSASTRLETCDIECPREDFHDAGAAAAVLAGSPSRRRLTIITRAYSYPSPKARPLPRPAFNAAASHRASRSPETADGRSTQLPRSCPTDARRSTSGPSQTQLSHQTKKYDLKSKHCRAQSDLGTTRAKVVEALTEVRRAKIDGPALIFDDQLCELHSSNTDASTSASSRSMPNVLGKDSDF